MDSTGNSRKPLPAAPRDSKGKPIVPDAVWAERQLFLSSKGVPHDVLVGVSTLKRMNIFLMAYSFPSNIYFQPDWKFILDAERDDPRKLDQILIWKQRLRAMGLG